MCVPVRTGGILICAAGIAAHLDRWLDRVNCALCRLVQAAYDAATFSAADDTASEVQQTWPTRLPELEL